ncbi:MAG: hypothetical protein M1454_03980 [Candidatus Thermoplasmatota archaeon]|nr:hypothetical protein [Candidatus Thermoplasmatota archaeon]MCL5731394.1 hypothetical protein [Candidatus Thermoplasmatota archaeon]
MDRIHSIARRDLRCEDVLRSLYDINDIECRAFFVLSSVGSATLDEMAELLHKERSSVHRILEKLVSLRLCYKESESIRGGGHKNIYYAIPPGSVRNDAVSILEDFYLAMKEKAECLDQYIAMEISKYASAYSENR